MVWPREHKKIATIADRVPVKVECASCSREFIVKPDRDWVDLVVLIKERLVAGLGELYEAEDTCEGTRGGNRTGCGRDSSGRQCDR